MWKYEIKFKNNTKFEIYKNDIFTPQWLLIPALLKRCPEFNSPFHFAGTYEFQVILRQKLYRQRYFLMLRNVIYRDGENSLESAGK